MSNDFIRRTAVMAVGKNGEGRRDKEEDTVGGMRTKCLEVLTNS